MNTELLVFERRRHGSTLRRCRLAVQEVAAKLEDRSIAMASAKPRQAARRNIKKAARAAKSKRTIAHLPKSTRRALGKQAAKSRNS